MREELPMNVPPVRSNDGIRKTPFDLFKHWKPSTAPANLLRHHTYVTDLVSDKRHRVIEQVCNYNAALFAWLCRRVPPNNFDDTYIIKRVKTTVILAFTGDRWNFP